jgi:hypothetical protein
MDDPTLLFSFFLLKKNVWYSKNKVFMVSKIRKVVQNIKKFGRLGNTFLGLHEILTILCVYLLIFGLLPAQ